VTYRIGPHSTADDATRYRPGEEVDQWKAMDPLDRYRSWLASSGAADDEFFQAVDAEAKEFAGRMRSGVIGSGPRPVEEMFEWVFADLPPHLARQRDEVIRFAQGSDEGKEHG
jgi:pyruvate dehydrogenase E1 component alpha subunit